MEELAHLIELFLIFQGKLPWQRVKVEKSAFCRTNLLCRYAIRKRNGIRGVYGCINSSTNATITCKILVKIGPVVSVENRLTNGNCVACSRGLTYFVEYLWTYWTDFRNLFTIWKRLTCRWWNSNLFSHLSRDVAMATSQIRKIGVFPGPIYFVAMPFGNGMG